MPFGGVKDSGLGREGLRSAIDESTEPRMLALAGLWMGAALGLVGRAVGGDDLAELLYLALAFCAAHRLRCASAIRLRASALNTRRFFPFLGAFAAFLVLLPVSLTATLLALASRVRAC